MGSHVTVNNQLHQRDRISLIDQRIPQPYVVAVHKAGLARLVWIVNFNVFPK